MRRIKKRNLEKKLSNKKNQLLRERKSFIEKTILKMQLLNDIFFNFLLVYYYSVNMLKGYVHLATFILAVVGLVGCAGRFDYNFLLALGWIYLADKHPFFSNSFAVYVS